MEALARLLVQSAPSAVLALDHEGRVIMLNPTAERLLGTSLDDAIGQLYQDVLGSSLSDRLVSLFLRSLRTGDSMTPRQIRATLPGGRRADLRASLGPIRDGAGNLVGVLMVADEAPMAPDAVEHLPLETAARLRVALRRYLGESVATMVEERPSFIGVGGVRKHISVLHADIRGYTTFAEALEPEQVATMLLRYHSQAVDVLQKEGATLDRFIGDSVLALWNAPAPFDGHARAAIRGALAVQQAARSVGNELAYGIGLHTGDAVVGNVGNENFLNYTAIGDTVNVAARLQNAAAAGEIVCSEVLLGEAGDGIRTKPLGPLQVKGRQAPVIAHRVEGFEGETRS